MLELSYLHGKSFDEKFVQIRAANEAEDLLNELCSSRLGGAYVVEGPYGSGKSTLLNYMARLLETKLRSANMIPIFIKLTELTKISNVRECAEMIDAQMIESLRNSIERHLEIDDISTLFDKFLRSSRPVVECLRFLERRGYRAVFLIDELDKIEERIAKLYISKYQPTGETLWKRGHITFWAVHSDWRLRRDPRFSFIHRRILIERWTISEIVELLDKRIKIASMDKETGVEDIFDREALHEVYVLSEGFPRKAQEIAELSMRYAANLRRDKVSRDDVREARKLDEERSLHQVILNKLFQIISEDPELQKIFKKLINLVREEPLMINTLVRIIVEEKIDERDITEEAKKHLERMRDEGFIKKVERPQHIYVPIVSVSNFFNKLRNIVNEEARYHLKIPRKRRKKAEIEIKNWVSERLRRFFKYLFITM